MNHYTVPILNAFLDKQLPVAQGKEIEVHLQKCKSCQNMVKEIQSDDNLLLDVKAAVVEYRKPLPSELDDLISSSLTAAFSGVSGMANHIPDLPPQHPEAPTVPEYSLLEIIGKGGYGTVWLAQDRLGAKCAVKILEKDKKHHPGEKEIGGLRLMSISEISHLNLISVKHVGESKDFWYYVMELVDDTLKNKMDRLEGKPLPPEDAFKIIKELLTVLSECHRQGVAHRDIKPENIGFKKGVLKLIDLGLVTSSSRTDRTLVGTPDYMPVKPSSTPSLDDLYAAGMILYTMLTGKRPNDFPKLPADIEANPLFHKLNKIACKACDRDPESRFQSAEEFLSTIGIADGKIWKNIKTSVSSARKPKTGRILLADGQGLKTKHKTKETKMKEKIKAAVKFLKDNNLPVSARLKQEAMNLENPCYKVGFVGSFQVGKSTLINKVFLRDDVLLKEGYGICTTAVATEVTYGAEKKMEVYPWTKKREPVSLTIDGKVVPGETEVITGVGTPTTFLNPTKDDIAKATTSTKLEVRTQLAQNTASAKLFWPAESLKRYILMDTPGIDDPNTILLDNTTYRILPEMDVAIMIVEPRILGQVQLDLLRSRMLDQGISRIMILISYQPDSHPLPEDTRQELIDSIKAQLSIIGREYILVKMYCFDETVGGNILNNPDKIEKAIIGFLETNVEPGRIEKAVFAAKCDIQSALLQVATKQAFAGKADAEKRSLLNQIRTKEEELECKYNEIADGIGNDLLLLKQRIMPDANAKLFAAGEAYLKGFDDCRSFSDATERLVRADIIMKPDIEKMIFDLVQTVKRETESIVKKFDQKARAASEQWSQLLSVDLHVEGGLLSRVPSILVTIADLVTSCIILPGGPIIDLILRYIAGKIPVIRNFMPQQIATRIMVNSINNSVRGEINRMAIELSRIFDEAFKSASISIKEEFARAFKREVGVIRDTAEQSAPMSVSPEQQARLVELKTRLEGVLAGL